MSVRFGSPTLSRSDEEIRNEMDRDQPAYCAGWPTLEPLPLNTYTNGASKVENAGERLAEVQSILETQRISHSTSLFAFRVPADAEYNKETNNNLKYLTLLFTADMSADFHKIENTILRIRSHFRNHPSTATITIECIDYRVQRGLFSFPISHEDTAILKKMLLRRGLEDDPASCPPTVVITTPSARDSEWSKKLKPSILSKINSPWTPDFKIEVVLGIGLLTGRKKYAEKAGTRTNAEHYEKEVRMGSSIGIATLEKGSGTMGGSVTLEGGVECALTNWHVVRDDKLDNILKKSTKGFLEVDDKTLKASPQTIVSPSNQDHYAFLGRIQATFREVSDLLVDLSSTKDTHPHYVFTYQASRQDLSDELKKFEHYPRELGNGYAGSGRRSVEVNKYTTDKKTGKAKKVAKNEACFALNQQPNQEPGPGEDKDEEDFRGLARKPCEHWSVFDVEEKTIKVAKYGRTTGWTRGKLNSALAYIKPEAKNAEDPKNEEDTVAESYGFTQEKPGRCFVVTNPRLPGVLSGQRGLRKHSRS
ncbi:hypothetical protein BDW02DRAFT_649377 [Decorospora gaudefroyi]|uniref:Uncharacterized protein n=1 Tax=Decorospora gaudefroyi TaxID=184978 RepID=A0A6A5K5A9_9PLEO|nr:hypothetical protein BDW02DRAFT_649377 [Decorospora gaudefroyi]